MAEYIEYEAGKKYKKRDGEISDTHKSFSDCGKVIEDNMMVVDIDDIHEKLFLAMVKEFRIQNEWWRTEEGFHVWCQKPKGFSGTSGICAGGFEVEYKTKKNVSITVKLNGQLREVHNEGNIAPLPAIFQKRSKRKYFSHELLGMTEGSRNDSMFKHAMELQGVVKNRNQILEFINTHVLGEALSHDEIQNILKYQVTAQKDGEFLLARQLLGELKALNYRGELYVYDDDRYINGDSNILPIIRRYCPEEKVKYVKEVHEQLKLDAKVVDQDTLFTVKLNNGFLEHGQFIELEDYDEFTPYSIRLSYDPNAKPVPIVDEFLKNVTGDDPDYKALVLEMMAHGLIVDPSFKSALGKFFFIQGKGGNGKGTLVKAMGIIYGDENAAWLSPKQICDDKFQSQLSSALVNIGDDVEKGAINDEQMKALKNISTCDNFSSRVLFAQGKTVRYTTSLVFTTNHPMKSFEKGEAFKRRVVYMPVDYKPKKKDPKYLEKLTTPAALKYWIKLLVEAYFRLYAKGEFTHSEKVQTFTEESHLENDNLAQYLEDMNEKDFLDKPLADAFREYKDYCIEEEVKPLSKSSFKEAVCDRFEINTGVKGGTSKFMSLKEAAEARAKRKAQRDAQKKTN